MFTHIRLHYVTAYEGKIIAKKIKTHPRDSLKFQGLVSNSKTKQNYKKKQHTSYWKSNDAMQRHKLQACGSIAVFGRGCKALKKCRA